MTGGEPLRAETTEIEDVSNLFEMSVEELMQVRIRVASRREEALAEAAAAVFVLTRDDIRRSGATSLPEVLRLVPGANVARIDQSKWAVSIRGFNGRFSNKLLVLIDGRSVYTALNSGVYWDVQDTVLEDIERIEVVRGPGGSTWGINAVNGVINIVTRSAHDTRGSLLVAGGGDQENGFATLRHGGAMGEVGSYRVFGKFFDRASSSDGHDAWSMARGGFRLDLEPNERDRWMVAGGVYRGTPDERVTLPIFPPRLGTPPFSPSFEIVDDEIEVEGGDLMVRWVRRMERGEMELLAFWDVAERRNVTLGEERQALNLDFEQRLQLGPRHDLVWGLGHRNVHDETEPSFVVAFDPPNLTVDYSNAFVQSQTSWRDDHLRLTLGTKLEHNDFTGFSIQPTLRLAWLPRRGHTLWAAVSRAVRASARSNQDIRVNFVVLPGAPGAPCLPGASAGCPVVGSSFGTRDFETESVLAVEAGYRFFDSERMTFDIATFANDYRDLASSEPCGLFFESDPVADRLVLCRRGDNEIEATSFGFELAANLELTSAWQLHFTYGFLELDAETKPGSLDTTTVAQYEGESPEQTITLRSELRLPGGFEFDTIWYWIDALPARGVEAHTRLDARFSWRLDDRLELGLVIQNAFEPRHREWGGQSTGTLAASIERSIYGKITARF